jgi:hypothetical protein
MSIDTIEEYEAQKDYERVDGFVYEDAVSRFVFCGNCDDGRCRPDGDEWACANDCGRVYTRETSEEGTL